MKRNINFQNIVDDTIKEEYETDSFLQSAHLQIQENKRLKKEKCIATEKSVAGSSGSKTENVGVKYFNRKHLVFLFICAFVAVAIILILCLMLVKNGDITYSYKGDTRVSSIEELNSQSDIQFNEVDGLSISCAIDSDYNVDLFYIIRYLDEETNSSLSIVIETNKDYQYGFIDFETWECTTNLKDYTLNYCYQEKELLDEEIYLINIAGKIECGTNVYITYEGFMISGESNFISILEELIK